MRRDVLLGALLLGLGTLWTGCDDEDGIDYIDMAPTADMAVGDDMAVAEDMMRVPDMAEADMAEADMAVEPDMEAPPPDCQQVCFGAAFCAARQEPEDICPGLWFVDLQALVGGCVGRCMAEAGFGARIAGALPACGAVRDILVEDADFAALCENGLPSPPAVAECGPRGARIAECLVGDCAEAAPIQAGVSELLTLGCERAVAAGDLTAAEAGAITAETGCDDAAITATIADLRLMGQRREFILPMEGLCTHGPDVPPAVCDDVCTNTTACAPDSSVLSSDDACLAACLTGAGPDDVAQAECAAAAEGCAALATCYTGR